MNSSNTSRPDSGNPRTPDLPSDLIYKYSVVATVSASSLAGCYCHHDQPMNLLVLIPHLVSLVLASITRTRQAGIVILICSIMYSIWGAIVLSQVVDASVWNGMVVMMGIAMASPILLLMWIYAFVVDIRIRAKIHSG